MFKSRKATIKKTTLSAFDASDKARRTPVVLAILDGWGIGPSGNSNAIRLARTPNLENLERCFPHTELLAHGRHVGLLTDQEGNSEAGHSNIGAGRVVRQDILYITEAIKDHTFFKNLAFHQAIEHVKKKDNATMHIVGLLSNGNSAHASPDHLYALLKLMHEQNVKRVRAHLFTDGRDSTPHSAPRLLRQLEENMHEGQSIASIMGRFYGMDRNKWWVRTKHAYDAIVLGEGLVARDVYAATLSGYNRGETDEFLLPTVIVDDKNRPKGLVQDGDSIIFFNLRSDRARQLAKTFVQDDFNEKNNGAFERRRLPKDLVFVAMTDFGPDLDSINTAFPSRDIECGLTEVLGKNKVRQFYIAEGEKYAHVTYFFNGGYADARFNEERMRVPSQFIPHAYMQPKMRAGEITSEVIKRLRNEQYDFIVLNLANADMVAHSGNIAATIQAIEEIDRCLGKLSQVVLAQKGTLLVVGDHGNAENMLNEKTGEMITEHSINPVPFILVNDAFRNVKLRSGLLADVAPTILDLMNISKPTEMTGFSLLRLH
jgi:2,3-bisphosphoglycerate-independent phosphoglycerate mutase